VQNSCLTKTASVIFHGKKPYITNIFKEAKMYAPEIEPHLRLYDQFLQISSTMKGLLGFLLAASG
jgi:hypothetical protein